MRVLPKRLCISQARSCQEQVFRRSAVAKRTLVGLIVGVPTGHGSKYAQPLVAEVRKQGVGGHACLRDVCFTRDANPSSVVVEGDASSVVVTAL